MVTQSALTLQRWFFLIYMMIFHQADAWLHPLFWGPCLLVWTFWFVIRLWIYDFELRLWYHDRNYLNMSIKSILWFCMVTAWTPFNYLHRDLHVTALSACQILYPALCNMQKQAACVCGNPFWFRDMYKGMKALDSHFHSPVSSEMKMKFQRKDVL